MDLQPILTDDERFPLIKDKEFLKTLRQDSAAPRYNFKSGDRLSERSLDTVQEYAQSHKTSEFWKEKELPHWIESYVEWCRRTVPAYKVRPGEFLRQPSIRREDIAASPWNYVSDECDVDDLLVYSTSGTTGAPMDVLFDAASQAAWIPQMETILRREGLELKGGRDTVSVCLICSQEKTLTYASLSTYLNGAGILKINLNPDDWNDPDDRKRYLEKYNPEILTGDPFAFLALAKLNPKITPTALVSSAMKLSEGVRTALQEQFNCPVFDIYSLTECRMVAYSTSENMHHLIRPELYIEILDPDSDEVLPLGTRGEIAITGGNNPFLPLIRYRTGDFGSLAATEKGYAIVDLEGRDSTVFKTTAGTFLNNVDISRAMSSFVLSGFTLHQQRDCSVFFEGWGDSLNRGAIEKTLEELFGTIQNLQITLHDGTVFNSKKVIYTSEFSEGDIA